MSSIYCPSCGFKNSFTSARPNFCSSCGQPFSSFAKVAPKQPDTSVSDHDLDEEGSDIYDVPDVSKLDVDISYEGMAKIHNPRDFFDPKDLESETTNRNASDKKKTTKRRRRRKGS